MSPLKLIARSASYYWRTQLGVAAAAAVATAVLVGALAVGDSVRWSLRRLALRRLGDVEVALTSRERFFRASPGGCGGDLAAELAAALDAPAAAVLKVSGTARRPDGTAGANGVAILGVDGRFWALGGTKDPLASAGRGAVAVNTHLAAQLGVKVGDEIILRAARPSALPREAPLSSDRDMVAAMRLRVRAVVGDGRFGRFSLRADQLAPYNAFVPLGVLQERLGQVGRADVLLLGRCRDGRPVTVRRAAAALRRCWRLADAGLELRRLGGRLLELRSRRIFLDSAVSRAALAADRRAMGILTYFADEVRLGDRSSPYCMVSAMGPAAAGGPPGVVPPGMGDGEIILNDWLARDIGAARGDTVTLSYRTMGPMRTFQGHRRSFVVRKVVPIAGEADDPNLMPDFPGLADVENCRDWRPGLLVDLDLIRPKDELYWKNHRGTPKAFVTLSAGRAMWANRFGDLTAVRYSLAAAAEPGRVARAIEREILARLDPAGIGLYFLPVRRQALAASTPTSDFGGLLLGLSFFLIAAAVLLTALLFVFGVQRRSRQVGLMLALGFRAWYVRAMLMGEGLAVALAGIAAGAFGGLLYTKAVLLGLGSIWRPVSASAPVTYHAEVSTVFIGAGAGLVVALAAMFFALVLQGRLAARELLAAGPEGRPARLPRRRCVAAALVVSGCCLAVAAALVAAAAGGAMRPAGAFFGSGIFLLLGTLGLCYAALAAAVRSGRQRLTGLRRLGFRSAGLRRGRSLATVALLAFGVFLVASVEVFRLDPNRDAQKKTSGTGGFALYAESSVPILYDLNDPDRRMQLHLAGRLDHVRVVHVKVHAGDDASCLNLNRAQSPRVLGVRPGDLAGRFTFVETLVPAGPDPWKLLARKLPGGEIPAVGDAETLQWALHKAVGETITVRDERGRDVRLRFVGAIAGSIFQGSVI
ncbi:MAG: FtsX-like permease family protein, partial [Planctomycetes bacterium]|nr:FtsX-like permease family protein [Planctomycetota bacterium]